MKVSLKALLILVPTLGILLGLFGPTLWQMILSFRNPPYQNAANPADVDGDGTASANDALLVLQALNTNGPGDPLSADPKSLPPYWDTDGNGLLTAKDALEVINALNQQQASTSP